MFFSIIGQSQCPDEGGWTMQYSGYMMASTDANKSENICIDAKHESQANDASYSDQSLSYVVVELDNGNSFIPCAVCSK